MENKHFIKLKVSFYAFTLTEVLITLGIIGIVAAMTIPTIINSSEKQSTVSKVKEIYSILSQATQQINNDCGGDISGCITSTTAGNDNDNTARKETANLYKAKLKIAKDCTSTITGCFPNESYKWLNNTNDFGNLYSANYLSNGKIILTNGMSIAFDWNGTASNYFDVFVDINGTKKPNLLGKDFFLFTYNLNQRTLNPHIDNSCSTSSSGGGCSGKILQEGVINYY